MAYEGPDEMAQTKPVARGERRTDETSSVLRVQLAVEPHPGSGCAVVNAGTEAAEVTQQLKSGTGGDGPGSDAKECHTEVTFDQGAARERSYLKAAVSARCICPVFDAHDCIPRIQGVRGRSVVVSLTVADRETLREIISDLRHVGASVSVDWLVSDGELSSTAEIDVSTITDKQHAAMEVAMEMGYYETPREVSLGELAAELDISESAASQRLNGAETKLVRAFLES